jgi:hypothetical protein
VPAEPAYNLASATENVMLGVVPEIVHVARV